MNYKLTKGALTAGDNSVYKTAADELAPIKTELNKAKALQDPVRGQEWDRRSEAYEAVYQIRRELKDKLRDKTITVAWIKYYEICMNSACIDDIEAPKIFFNGELPGAGIKAVQYYSKHMLKKPTVDWVASSLLPTKQNTALEDVYGLYKQNRARWLMDEKHNGDLTAPEMHKYWAEKLTETIDVYFSDAAGPVKNFDEQESEHLHIFIGSVLAALNTLKNGGRMVVKFYTCFEALTISVVAAVASIFDKTYLYKPLGSKRDNSEVYLLAFGYQKDDKVIAELTNTLTKKSYEPIGLRAASYTIARIVAVEKELAAAQGKKIAINVESFKTKSSKAADMTQDDVQSWYRNNPI